MTIDHETPANAAPRRRRTARLAALTGAAALVAGGGGLLMAQRGAGVPLTPIAPTPVAKLTASGAVAAIGDVKEIYGQRFVLQDASGRTLVDLGPAGAGRGGAGRGLVAKDETGITVQGRFEEGELHAALLSHADGHKTVLAPPPPPGPLGRIEDRLGLGPAPDVPALTADVQAAGYTNVRVTGRGPRHLEIVAKGADGKDHDLRVGFDGRVESFGAL